MPSSQVGTPGITLSTQITIREVTSAGYTVTNADLVGQVMLRLNNGASQNLTINTGLIPQEPCTFLNTGSGLWTFVAGAGVTLRSAGGLLRLNLQYSMASLIPVPNIVDEFWVVGDLA